MTGEPVDSDQYGMPTRAMEWHVVSGQVTFQRRATTEHEEVYLLVVDTGDNRNITTWTREELETMLRTGLTFLGAIPDGLLLTDPNA